MIDSNWNDASHARQRHGIRSLCLRSSEEIEHEFKRIGVDPAGIARMLPKLEQHAILIPQVKAAAANILKQEMLSLGGDAAVARGTVACSVAVTDALLIGTGKHLSILCRKLSEQPFGLRQIAKELETVLQQLYTPHHFWQTSRRCIQLNKPVIMGILNVTPDSFSDGGIYSNNEKALDRALQMIDEGADIIDIGGESTRPGSEQVSSEEELKRIMPVIEALTGRLDIPVSVDTWKSDVAAAALSAGAEIINDISGFTFDENMASVVASNKAGVVLMHTRGKPDMMQQNCFYENLMGDVFLSLSTSASVAVEAGIGKHQIVIDPGFGFAKDTAGNLEILRRISELKVLGYPVLAGTSRKTFIGKVTGRTSAGDRLSGTAATVALAVASGVKIVRVHDISAMKDAAMMAHAVASGIYPAE